MSSPIGPHEVRIRPGDPDLDRGGPLICDACGLQLLRSRNGLLHVPRAGYVFQEEAICSDRSCRAVIAWWRTTAGKMSPHDLDGTSHFATCPGAAGFRRGRKAQDGDSQQD